MCFLVLVMLVSGKENNFFEFGSGQNAVLEKMGQLGSRRELMVTISSNAMRAVLDHAAGPAVLMNSISRNQGKDGHMRIVSDAAGESERNRGGFTMALRVPFHPGKSHLLQYVCVY